MLKRSINTIARNAMKTNLNMNSILHAITNSSVYDSKPIMINFPPVPAMCPKSIVKRQTDKIKPEFRYKTEILFKKF
jgi:hypothetical protein